MDDVTYKVTAVSQQQQGRWTNWEKQSPTGSYCGLPCEWSHKQDWLSSLGLHTTPSQVSKIEISGIARTAISVAPRTPPCSTFYHSANKLWPRAVEGGVTTASCIIYIYKTSLLASQVWIHFMMWRGHQSEGMLCPDTWEWVEHECQSGTTDQPTWDDFSFRTSYLVVEHRQDSDHGQTHCPMGEWYGGSLWEEGGDVE